jgi:hypothetical protein
MPFFTIFALKLARVSLFIPVLGGFLTVIAGVIALAGAIQAPNTLRDARMVILCNIANLLLISPYLFSVGAASGIGPFPLAVTILLAVQLSLLAGLIVVAKTKLFINHSECEVRLDFNVATQPIIAPPVTHTAVIEASANIETQTIRTPSRPKGRKPIPRKTSVPVRKAA